MATKRKSKPVVALARRRPTLQPEPRQQIELVIHDPRQMLPVPPAASLNTLRELDDKVLIGGLGTVELKFTEAEEKIFNEPVLESEVLIKPTGQAYLPHGAYTRWFNRALGRGAWQLVPVSKVRISGSTVVCEYMLHIHGKPVAFALGEQEYHESNKEQTYGDAYEATNASALRRVAKRLGIGLELWDRRWLNSFMDRTSVKVWKDGEKRPFFRRVDDPPFWWEQPQPRRDNTSVVNMATGEEWTPPPPQQTSRPIAQRADGDTIISNIARDPKNPNKKVGQVQRLAIIIRGSGRDIADVKAWLAIAYGYTSTKDILRKHYDAICAAVESPNPLPPGPLQQEREPGEEG